ncbi:Rieske (2Fe-2S) protein [Pseudonocardia bannensis]|uniref:Rieske 2Fe-2S domain-containing protein n=1 Tax=Pseudonocardia bannensis TaxID=630973 RepID=A0A848DJJ8_9PSEU|nr:Rieske 2Fe-2S domain-containing protein [Pseudonocardia bannensis]NMH92706.1 Rieske 2Fe-2S domain-containing protein [Pseudonocardia bannensis]
MSAPARRQVVVAEDGEIPPGGSRIVEVEGRSIGVFNLGGEYFAVRNACPHAGGPLCEGVRSGFVRSEGPGHYDYVRRGEFLRCPWHQWEFDIRTGRSWFDPDRVRVRRYDTRLVTGSELLDGEADLVDAGLQPGPYTAETYPVRSTGRYVVLEL